MRIRTATGDDAREIGTVRVLGWRWAYRGLLPDEVLDGMSIGDDEARWRRALVDGDGGWRAAVAERDGVVVGFVAYGSSRDADAGGRTAEIGAIYVRPEVAGTGIGRALMAAALAALGRDGYDEATLWTLEGNLRARRFYERGGWRTDGARKTDDAGRFEEPEIRYRIGLGGT